MVAPSRHTVFGMLSFAHERWTLILLKNRDSPRFKLPIRWLDTETVKPVDAHLVSRTVLRTMCLQFANLLVLGGYPCTLPLSALTD